MNVKMEAGCGITKISILIHIGWVRDEHTFGGSAFDGGRDTGNRKSQVTDVTRRTATVTRRDRDKHSE